MNPLLSEEKGEGIIRCAPRPIAPKPLKQIGQSDGGGAKGTNAPGGAELGSSSLNSICATIVIQFLSFFLAAEEPLSKVGGGKREKKG